MRICRYNADKLGLVNALVNDNRYHSNHLISNLEWLILTTDQLYNLLE